jgi:hypothetical protein
MTATPTVSGVSEPAAEPSRPGGEAISLRRVIKRFGEITAVDGLDLEVPAVAIG